MLIDCHLHTSRYSACSRIAPLEACELARAAGLSAIVFTEHQRLWPGQELKELRQGAGDLAVYSGMEITLAEGYDIVVIAQGLPREMPYCLSLSRVRKALSALRSEAFVFLAHAFRYVNRLEEDLISVLEYVDALELNSVNVLRNGIYRDSLGLIQPLDLALYEKARELGGLAGIYNSDAHRASALGSIASRLEAEALPRDEAALAQLLKNSQLTQWQNSARLREHIGMYLS